MSRLIVILGDQLNMDIASLRDADPASDTILMAEVMEEATYVGHHKKKIAFVLSAMRHFAVELQAAGYKVIYSRLDEPENSHSLVGEIERAVSAHALTAVIVAEAGEWRLRQQFTEFKETCAVPVDIRRDDRFLCSEAEFAAWADGRKQLRMEYFYRDMRRKTGLLMDGGKPEGGKWNYDSENRQPPPGDMFLSDAISFDTDLITNEVLRMVAERFPSNFGDLEPFWFAVTRRDAEKAVAYFIQHLLPDFGAYQDAMMIGQRFLYHSVLSHYINIGLLDGLEVCRQVEAAYRAGKVPLNSAEGFIRQIIGWREYVRGIYFLKMPSYEHSNFLGAANPLPAFYWTGETDMLCMSEAITQTKEEAYAHHIQRLMVTGNFALISGIAPHELHEWYLAVYADAYEWVEMPNTIGMSQFADGGLLGSKPYAASGNYINKMSNYCSSCRYKVKEKTGPNSCPFNSLYWDFMIRNRDRLAQNPRVSRVYVTWDRMKPETRTAYLDTARHYLGKLETGERI